MVGLQSLATRQAPMPGQAQMPGQAPQAAMPGMMPKARGPQPGVQALVPSLMGMDLQQLLMLFNDPNSPVPKNRILAAMTEKQKEMAARQAVQGQMAMAQAQQQPGTVKDQVVQGAMQGAAQGYAGGGAVAFQHGGPVQKFQYGAGPRGVMAQPSMLTTIEGVPIYTPGPDREPGETEAEYLARKQKEAAEADEVSNRPLRRLYRYLAEKIREPSAVAQMRAPAAQAAQPAAAAPAAAAASPAAQPTITDLLSALEPPKGPMMPIPEIQIAPSPAPAAGPRRQPVAPTAPAPAVPTQGLQNLVDLDKAQKEELDRLQGRQAVDPTVAAARAAERKGAEEIAAGRQTRAEAQRTEAQRQLDEALKRGRTSLFDDPEALLRVAAGIDTRRGKGMGTFAGGIADIMGQRRAEATAARKDFQTAQNAYNQEMNALDTLRQLQRERDTAIATGDVAAARAIQDQITNVNRFYQKAKEDRQTAERNYQLDVLKTQATQDQARAALTQAGKPTDAQSRIALYRSDPKAYEAMYGPKESASVANLVRAVNSDPALKSLAEGLKLGTLEAETRYNARYKELVATYAPELLLGAGGGGGGGALEAATAIARGGK